MEAIADGMTLSAFCKQDGKPDRRNVARAILASPEWQEKFTAARSIGADALAEEALEILDTDPGTGPKGGKDPGAVQWLRARFDGRMRLLAKWDTARYGDRVQLAGDPNAPLQGMSRGEIEAEIVAMLKKAAQRKVAKNRIGANGNSHGEG